MLLLPLVCVVVRSAKQFSLQCTLEVCSYRKDVIAVLNKIIVSDVAYLSRSS